MSRLALFVAIGLLAGCKSQLTAEIYTSDILAVASGETLDVPILFENEVPGEENCREYGPKLAQAFAKGFSEAEFVGCAEEGYTHLVQIRVRAPMWRVVEGEAAPVRSAASIGVSIDGNKTWAVFATDTALAEAIWGAMPSEISMMRAANSQLALRAEVMNDTRDPVTVAYFNAFVDGRPVMYSMEEELRGRDKLTIQMSDVANATFAEGIDGVPFVAVVAD